MIPIYGNCVGGVGLERTYILVDEDGKEFTATFVDNETALDATPNDIRLGKLAATDTGVTVGEKMIPSYHTSEGTKVITAGSQIKITNLNNCNYTKLQALICVYQSSLSSSVATEKVSINGKVYAVGSTDVLAEVIVESENKAIDFGLVNDSESPRVIRYFTYKEEF